MEDEYLDPLTGMPIEKSNNESNPLLDELTNLGEQSFNAGNSGKKYQITDKNLKSYTDYLGEHIDPLDQNLDYRRAQSQSGLQQTANAFGRLTNIIPGVVGGLASTLDIPSYFDSADTSNWLTDYTNEIQDNVRESMPVFRENPNVGFDMGDPAWWLEGGSDMVKSAAEFMVEGAVLGGGIGKAVSMTGKGLRNLNKAQKYKAALNTIKKTNGFIDLENKVGTFANAYVLNHIESTMEANDVYNQTLNDNIKKGLSYEKSQQLAADAASTTSKINKLNIILNLTSAGKFFKSPSTTRNLLKEKTLIGAAKELGFEGSQESVEELVNHVGSEMGKIVGKDKEWTSDDVFKALGQEHAWSAAFWGAMGGIAQTGGTNLINNTKYNPSSPKDKDGNRISINDDYQRRYDEQQKVINSYDELDVKGITETANSVDRQIVTSMAIDKLNDAIDNGENIEENKAELKKLEDLQLVNLAAEAFQNGTTEKLISIFEGYRDMPQGKDTVDDYKEKANKAIKQIEDLEHVYKYSKDFKNSSEVFNNRAYKELLSNRYDLIKDEISKSETEALKNIERLAEQHGLSDFYYKMDKSQKNIDSIISKLKGEKSKTVNKSNSKTRGIIDKIFSFLPHPDIKQQNKDFDNFAKEADNLNEISRLNAFEDTLQSISKSITKLDKVFPDLISKKRQKEFINEINRRKETLKNSDKETVKTEEKNNKKDEVAKEYHSTKQSTDTAPDEGNSDNLSDEEIEAAFKKALGYDDQGQTSQAAKEKSNNSNPLASEKNREDQLKEDLPMLFDEEESNEENPFIKYVDNAVTLKELDSITDQADKEDQYTPELWDKISLKREELNKKINDKEFVKSVEDNTENTLQDVYTKSKEKTVEEQSNKLEDDIKEEGKELASDGVSYEYRRSRIGSNLLAYLSRKFLDTEKDGSVYREDVDNAIIDSPSKVLLDPDKFGEGTELTIEPDDNIETEVNNPFSDTKETITWGQLKNQLSEKDIPYYIPMVVKDINGNIVAHIHALDWITEKNVIEHKDDKEQLKVLRDYIYTNGSFDTKVMHKTPGVLIKNTEGLTTMSEVMEDPDIEIIFGRTNLENLEKQTSSKNLVNKDDIKPGITYAIIPVGNNKQFAMPLSNNLLSSNIIETIGSVIDIFFKQDENSDLRNEILDKQELDILDAHDLKKYMSQFVHSFTVPSNNKNLMEYTAQHPEIDSDYNLISIQAGTNNSLDISFAKGNVYLGNLGNNSLTNKDGSIKSDEEIEAIKGKFLKTFKEFLQTVHFNVGGELESTNSIVALNDSGEVDRLASNYKELVKDNMSTRFMSANIGTPSEPKYVYTIQPKISFDTSEAIPLKQTEGSNPKTDIVEGLKAEKNNLLDTLKNLEQSNMIEVAKQQSKLKKFFKITKQGVSDKYLYNQAVKEINVEYNAKIAALENQNESTDTPIGTPIITSSGAFGESIDVDSLNEDDFDLDLLPSNNNNSSESVTFTKESTDLRQKINKIASNELLNLLGTSKKEVNNMNINELGELLKKLCK